MYKYTYIYILIAASPHCFVTSECWNAGGSIGDVKQKRDTQYTTSTFWWTKQKKNRMTLLISLISFFLYSEHFNSLCFSKHSFAVQSHTLLQPNYFIISAIRAFFLLISTKAQFDFNDFESQRKKKRFLFFFLYYLHMNEPNRKSIDEVNGTHVNVSIDWWCESDNNHYEKCQNHQIHFENHSENSSWCNAKWTGRFWIVLLKVCAILGARLSLYFSVSGLWVQLIHQEAECLFSIANILIVVIDDKLSF